VPKSLQYGKVSRQLGPCGLPRPAQLAREKRSERRRDQGKTQGPRSPPVSMSTAASSTAGAASPQHSPTAAPRFQPAQPQKQPLAPAPSPEREREGNSHQREAEGAGSCGTHEAALPGYLPISLGCCAPSNPFLKTRRALFKNRSLAGVQTPLSSCYLKTKMKKHGHWVVQAARPSLLLGREIPRPRGSGTQSSSARHTGLPGGTAGHPAPTAAPKHSGDVCACSAPGRELQQWQAEDALPLLPGQLRAAENPQWGAGGAATPQGDAPLIPQQAL